MNKIIYVVTLLVCVNIQAQMIDFQENVSKNKFLGLDMSVCKITTNDSNKNYQKAYDCGNGSVSELLNVNFLDESNFGRIFYIYNNFMYWIGKNLQSGNKRAVLNSQPDVHFSGAGVFMIALGTGPYFQQLVAPNKTCPRGQQLVMAQLKYNDGGMISTWSQDAICLTPTDDFRLEVSKEEDNSVPTGKNVDVTDIQGVDWMKDPGPSQAYKKADSSPRKIRIIKKAAV